MTMGLLEIGLFAVLSVAPQTAAQGEVALREGMWIERVSGDRDPLRPLVASVITNRPSAARSGVATTARKVLPKAPLPRSGGALSKELRLILESARVSVSPGETFLFVFGEGRNSVWKVGSDVASHPKDFVIVPLDVKDRHRRAELDENGMFKEKVFSDFEVESVSSTQFRVSLPAGLPPGEYAWVYVGSGALKSGLRVFDFRFGAANPTEPVGDVHAR